MFSPAESDSTKKDSEQRGEQNIMHVFRGMIQTQMFLFLLLLFFKSAVSFDSKLSGSSFIQNFLGSCNL